MDDEKPQPLVGPGPTAAELAERAEAKRLQGLSAADLVAGNVRRAFEQWAVAHRIEAWKVRAAKEMHAWPVGAEVTEDEFHQAVYDACNHVIR